MEKITISQLSKNIKKCLSDKQIVLIIQAKSNQYKVNKPQTIAILIPTSYLKTIKGLTIKQGKISIIK